MKLFSALALGLAARAAHAQTTYTYNDLGDANAGWEYQPGSLYAPATIARVFSTGEDLSLQSVTIDPGTVSEIHLRMFIYKWSDDLSDQHTVGLPLYESDVYDFPKGTYLATFPVPNIFYKRDENNIIIFSGQGLARTGLASFAGVNSGGTEFKTSTWRDGDSAFNNLSKWGMPDAENYWNRFVPTLAVKLDFGSPVPEPNTLLSLVGVGAMIICYGQRSGKGRGTAIGTRPNR